MKSPQKFVLVIVLMLIVNLLWTNHSVSLWDEDEAAYAGFAINMIETSDWVNPEYKWSDIHRKTPFHFWTIALSFKIFGINEFALRLPSVLAIILTCLTVFLFGKNIFGEKSALYASIILATSIQVPLMGKIALTDATLLFAQTLSVLSLFNFLNNPTWKWNFGFWFGISLGILTKGPPIIILTGGIWLILFLFHPNRKNLIKTHPWFYGIIALLPFIWWCYLSYSHDYALWEKTGINIAFEEWWQIEKEGQKIHLLPFLWEWYIMKRIGGSVLDQTGFPGYHFIVLTIAFITWLPYWLLTILATFKKLIKPTEKNILLISWIIMGWFFWEFMNSKLPSYSLAAQPALALFMAIEISKRENQQLNKKWLQTGLTLYALIFVLIIIGVPFSGYYFFGNWTLAYLIPMSLILTLLLTQVVKNRNKDLMLFQYLALTGAIFMFLVWACISPVLEKSAVKSFDQVIEAAYNESGQNKNARIIFTGFDIKQTKISLIFYAEKQFGKYEEMHVPEAMMAFNNKQNTVLIIGQKYIKDYEIAFKKRGIPFNPQKILHRSTDDSLKEHNFWVIGNNKD